MLSLQTDICIRTKSQILILKHFSSSCFDQSHLSRVWFYAGPIRVPFERQRRHLKSDDNLALYQLFGFFFNLSASISRYLFIEISQNVALTINK